MATQEPMQRSISVKSPEGEAIEVLSKVVSQMREINEKLQNNRSSARKNLFNLSDEEIASVLYDELRRLGKKS